MTKKVQHKICEIQRCFDFQQGNRLGDVSLFKTQTQLRESQQLPNQRN